MRKQTGDERTAKHGENEMSEEKRIDRIERLVEENAKGIVELRLTVAENFSKALADNAEAREKMLVDNAETRERIRVDNAEAREAIHKVLSKISQDNAVLTRWMIAVSAVGGTFGGLIVVGTLLFPKIFGGG